MSQQREQAVANQVCSRLLATYHRDNRVCDDLFFCQSTAVDLRRHERMDEAIARVLLLLLHLLQNVGFQVVQTLEHLRQAIRIVLEVSQEFGEVC